jgi:leucyl-tRNA synthetase
MADHRPFASTEAKWQKHWEEEGTYRALDGAKGDKFYGLIEFPYPSGDGLHVGHPRSYTAIDVVTRKRRMEGKNVLYPIGWDAFGLPTENFAIKNKIKPQEATSKNVGTFMRQLKSIGFGFDWSREVNTTDPTYYKWTQWMFLKFFKSTFDDKTGTAKLVKKSDDPVASGDLSRMAYKARTTINWCPSCKIGLANEEAVGGVCERCGNPVEKREKAQWMIKITKYAERLLNDLDSVDYLDRIKAQQVNWIGKSEGAYVDFKTSTKDVVRVFTTRPDTLFGATYLVLAPEHELVATWAHNGLISNDREVHVYREAASKKSDLERGAEGKEKTGVRLEGITAVNPVNGEEIPVWIADYVLAGYGTGAIMAVPAHDERDFAFAKKFDIPVRYVIAPRVVDQKNPPVKGKKTVARKTVHALIRNPKTKKILCLQWKKHPWTTFVLGGVEEGEDLVEAARREIKEETGYTNLKFIRVLGGPVISEYFAAHKDENRIATATTVLFDLASDAREEVSSEELEKHEVIWLDRKELTEERMTCSELKYWLWGLDYPEAGAFTGEGEAIESDFLNGLATEEAKQKMSAWLQKKKVGETATNYKLRDWVFSRQRYWGEPIPIIICEKCGYVPVPEDQLPVLLPDVASYEPTDTGESPLSKIRDWVEVKCPSCGGDAERETDTMPNWAGSSWYFLRYCDPHNDKEFASSKALKYWMPVDLYNGGMEHTTLHLLYSRFWHKFLWDIGAIPKEIGSEPYKARRSHGLILAEGGEKMSKSKGNVVNPDDIVEQYGADVFRMYEMFMGPFDQPVPWDVNGIEGVRRFLDKVWRLFKDDKDVSATPDLETIYNQTIKKIGDDIESLSFNTAVSQLMILTNAFSDAGGVPSSMRDGYLQILAPFAPHMTEELWSQMGREESIHRSAWPKFDPAKVMSATFELVVQVNGKVRDKMTVSADISEEDAKAKALASEKVKMHLGDKQPSKIIYVKGRLVTIVV